MYVVFINRSLQKSKKPKTKILKYFLINESLTTIFFLHLYWLIGGMLVLLCKHRYDLLVQLQRTEFLSILNNYSGRKRRMGFGKKGKTSFTVHRSEEILPGDVRLAKQGSSASSDGEGSADGDRCLVILIKSTNNKL